MATSSIVRVCPCHGPLSCFGGSDECSCRIQGPFITDPVHGGKVTCHKCNTFICEGDGVGYLDHQNKDEFPNAWFHKKCFNIYEHYDGLDKPID